MILVFKCVKRLGFLLKKWSPSNFKLLPSHSDLDPSYVST